MAHNSIGIHRMGWKRKRGHHAVWSKRLWTVVTFPLQVLPLYAFSCFSLLTMCTPPLTYRKHKTVCLPL